MRALSLLSLSALGLLACSTPLPEYAAPQAEIIESTPPSEPIRDLIAYRTLDRMDFRGTQAPQSFISYADRVGAATCAFVFVTPESQVMVRQLQSKDGAIYWHASVYTLGFEAKMDRNCSWWNTELETLPPDYVLEHEQIHFALVELEARRMQADVPAISRRIEVMGVSRDEVRDVANQRLHNELQASMERIVRISREFDDDTSMGYKPDRQSAWAARAQAELAETQ